MRRRDFISKSIKASLIAGAGLSVSGYTNLFPSTFIHSGECVVWALLRKGRQIHAKIKTAEVNLVDFILLKVIDKPVIFIQE